MQEIESLMNSLTDMDWGWWPVVHLRPAKDENIDNSTLLKITPVFGTFAAIVVVFTGNIPMTFISMLICLTSCWVVFFLAYKFTFAIAWNSRAARLREANNETAKKWN